MRNLWDLRRTRHSQDRSDTRRRKSVFRVTFARRGPPQAARFTQGAAGNIPPILNPVQAGAAALGISTFGNPLPPSTSTGHEILSSIAVERMSDTWTGTLSNASIANRRPRLMLPRPSALVFLWTTLFFKLAIAKIPKIISYHGDYLCR